MHTLTFPFKILSFCGIWLPPQWQDQRYRVFLYRLFSACAAVGVYTFLILQCTLLFVNEFEIDFAADVLFILLTGLSVATKFTNFIVRRDRVMYLVNMLLLKSFCLPTSAVEIEMERKSVEFIRVFTIYFNALGQACIALLVTIPILQNPSERELPYPLWLPYELNSGLKYWMTFVVAVGLSIIGVLINVTVDVIVSGFVIQACMQFDILRYRLKELPKLVKMAKEKGVASSKIASLFENRILRQAVLHHDYIIKFTKVVTETFDVMIVEQFFAGALNFSVIIYILVMANVPILQKIMAFVYLICMAGELFAYCYFGNEITVKSFEFSNDIYNIDWSELSHKAKKMLIVIMMRTNQPIIMSYGHLVILNLESFKSILKITYTAFNVLTESS